MKHQIEDVKKIDCFNPMSPDDIFICCASWEERCLGTLRKFSDYKFHKGYVFVYENPNTQRDVYLNEMREILKKAGSFDEISTSKDEPISAIHQLKQTLNSVKSSPINGVITIDITTFTKRHLLFLLRSIDDMGLCPSIRLLYSEPEDYVTDLYLPMSTGIRQISSIPGFVGTQPLSKPALLVIFLGYESDRAISLFENLDPNEVILVIPDPPYHVEWEGRTEEMNKHLIALIGEDRIKYANSRDPFTIASELESITEDYNLDEWHLCIASLGTKPQLIGIYLFWQKHKGECSLIYSQPLNHNKHFYSKGIGKTWSLLAPKII
ncbi:hypothetical protein KAR91_76905 [Candidatus Pacearchaeota archaeon]|nr:hypothetical protein [Candidatus Pacearchaeota archaeon]